MAEASSQRAAGHLVHTAVLYLIVLLGFFAVTQAALIEMRPLLFLVAVFALIGVVAINLYLVGRPAVGLGLTSSALVLLVSLLAMFTSETAPSGSDALTVAPWLAAIVGWSTLYAGRVDRSLQRRPRA